MISRISLIKAVKPLRKMLLLRMVIRIFYAKKMDKQNQKPDSMEVAE
jgi:hypothetical protein